jgi:hypothetical protein
MIVHKIFFVFSPFASAKEAAQRCRKIARSGLAKEN